MRARLLAMVLLGAPAGTLAQAIVTPSGGQVPENLLRIEVALDQPLESPLDMQYVTLLDSAGKPIDAAFLDLALPDRSERNYSLLLHPGRIKRGVGPNLALGPALREGEHITLVIADPRLAQPIRKTWQVAPAQRTALAPAGWTIRAPAAHSRQPLVVSFPRAINASAVQLIAVAAPGATRLRGSASLKAGETQWHFVPSARWQSGQYELRVHPSLEDPAGNRLCAAFEERRQSEKRCEDDASLRFRVGAVWQVHHSP